MKNLCNRDYQPSFRRMPESRADRNGRYAEIWRCGAGGRVRRAPVLASVLDSVEPSPVGSDTGMTSKGEKRAEPPRRGFFNSLLRGGYKKAMRPRRAEGLCFFLSPCQGAVEKVLINEGSTRWDCRDNPSSGLSDSSRTPDRRKSLSGYGLTKGESEKPPHPE